MRQLKRHGCSPQCRPPLVRSHAWKLLLDRQWQRLHYLTYAAGILAIIHFVWRVKIDVSQPVLYGTVLAALLLLRVGFWLRKRAK